VLADGRGSLGSGSWADTGQVTVVSPGTARAASRSGFEASHVNDTGRTVLTDSILAWQSNPPAEMISLLRAFASNHQAMSVAALKRQKYGGTASHSRGSCALILV